MCDSCNYELKEAELEVMGDSERLSDLILALFIVGCSEEAGLEARSIARDKLVALMRTIEVEEG